jgi:hypothetical protein
MTFLDPGDVAMLHSPSLRLATAAAAVLLLTSCAEPPTSPDRSAQPAVVGTDPAPSSPGIFLGTDITPATCRSGVGDTDRDGLTDRCERALASSFAPQLAYAASDRSGREPRWAARPLGSSRVRVMYLLSLYFDDGAYGCTLGPILCGGHYGDSEYIVLDLYFSGSSGHWILDQAIYSAHGVYNVYPRLFAAYPGMNFPDRKGGYPRAFVALRKHALYRSDTECDDGELGLDECRADTFQRVETPDARDIGSRAMHTAAQDCVRSVVLTSSTAVECYWTPRDFGGWQGKTPKAGPYSATLGTFGF